MRVKKPTLLNNKSSWIWASYSVKTAVEEAFVVRIASHHSAKAALLEHMQNFSLMSLSLNGTLTETLINHWETIWAGYSTKQSFVQWLHFLSGVNSHYWVFVCSGVVVVSSFPFSFKMFLFPMCCLLRWKNYYSFQLALGIKHLYNDRLVNENNSILRVLS